MGRMQAVTERAWTKRGGAGGLLLVAGLALAGYGSYLHRTLAARVSAGQCDGCQPWHPLFVVTPIVVGAAFLLAGGYLLSR